MRLKNFKALSPRERYKMNKNIKHALTEYSTISDKMIKKSHTYNIKENKFV